jgi:hypothetical protein
MLFRKDIDRSCEYCAHAGHAGEDRMICAKHGIVSPTDQCRGFTYDPLKRTPSRPKAPDFAALEERDFSL